MKIKNFQILLRKKMKSGCLRENAGKQMLRQRYTPPPKYFCYNTSKSTVAGIFFSY